MALRRNTPVNEWPEFLSVPDICTLLDIGKSLLYNLVNSGALPSVTIGEKIVRIHRQALLSFLHHEQPELSGWHKVSEVLPPVDTYVWGWGNGIETALMRYQHFTDEQWRWHDANGWYEDGAITHWMPVNAPAPPQDDASRS